MAQEIIDNARIEKTGKDLVFVVSGGRTGTTFFGELLGSLIDDSFSVHEPDLLSSRYDSKLLHKLKTFGFRHMVIDRALGLSGIRNLSRRYLTGEESIEALVPIIHQHRIKYYRQLDQQLIIESNSQWYGLIPVILSAFPRAKIVGIVRDPREWVTSWFNYGALRNSSDLFRLFGQRRISPGDVGDKYYSSKWPTMSRFEKICWDWQFINCKISEATQDHANVSTFRFEDLFSHAADSNEMCKFLNFICSFEDRTYTFKFDPEIIRTPVNRATGATLSHWRDWTPETARQLDEICRLKMLEFGYGEEPEWQALLKK